MGTIVLEYVNDWSCRPILSSLGSRPRCPYAYGAVPLQLQTIYQDVVTASEVIVIVSPPALSTLERITLNSVDFRTCAPSSYLNDKVLNVMGSLLQVCATR